MTQCGDCGGPIIRVPLDVYRCDEQIGFDDVSVLNAAVQHRCGECGQVLGVHIPDVGGLEAAVAIARVARPAALTGSELRFLRRACGLQSKVLAEYLEVTPSTVSHWENDKEQIGAQSDKMVRLVVGYILADRARGVPFDKPAIAAMRIQHLSDAGAPRHEPFVFCRIKVRVDRERRTEWELEDKAA